jgi:hypothetical protein
VGTIKNVCEVGRGRDFIQDISRPVPARTGGAQPA